MNDDRPRDLDVGRIIQVLARSALPVLGTALVLALVTYFYSQTRPPVYEATVRLAALPSGGGNALINSTLITASPLPPSVVSGALRSPEVIEGALKDFQSKVRASAARDQFVATLRREQQEGDFESVSLASDINMDFVGVYSIGVQSRSAALAQQAANAFARSLLNWDRERALSGVLLARNSLEAQRRDLERRLAGEPAGAGAQTLRQLLEDTTLKLQQVTVLEETVGGTLSLLASAPVPFNPVSPRPLRDALLVLGGTLFFGTLLAFLLDQQQARIRSLEDLRPYSVPVMGILPPLQPWGRSMPVRRLLELVRHGAFREQMEFVRVSLLASVGQTGAGQTGTGQAGPAPAVMVSSAEVGAGKSTVTAGLALSLAGGNLRVLLLDADVFRSSQPHIWPRLTPADALHLGLHNVTLYRAVSPRVDLLINNDKRLDPERIQQMVTEIKRLNEYDVILVDAPPALQIADTLVLARSLDGLILLVSPQSERALVDRLVDEAARLQVRVLGFVMNRFQKATTSYSYQGHDLPDDVTYETVEGSRAR